MYVKYMYKQKQKQQINILHYVKVTYQLLFQSMFPKLK